MNGLICFSTMGAREKALKNIREQAPDVARCILIPSSLPDLVVQGLPLDRLAKLRQLAGNDARWFDDIHFDTV